MQRVIRCNIHFNKINCPNSQIAGIYEKHKVYNKKLTLASDILTIGSLSR